MDLSILATTKQVKKDRPIPSRSSNNNSPALRGLIASSDSIEEESVAATHTRLVKLAKEMVARVKAVKFEDIICGEKTKKLFSMDQ